MAKGAVERLKWQLHIEAKRHITANRKNRERTERLAAIKLQSAWRRKQARGQVNHRRAEVGAEKRKKEKDLEKRRFMCEMKRKEVEQKLLFERETKRSRAAIQIQTAWRGKKARRALHQTIARKKDRALLEKKLRAIEAQKITGRPIKGESGVIHMSKPRPPPRPWDSHYTGFAPSNRGRDGRGQLLRPKKGGKDKFGPPQAWNTSSWPQLSVEEDVAAAMQAIDERLYWAGSQRRLSRHQATAADLREGRFATDMPGSLREATLDAARSAAVGTIAPVPQHLQPQN